MRPLVLEEEKKLKTILQAYLSTHGKQNHPQIAQCYHNLGKLYDEHKDRKDAIEYLEKARSMYSECLGAEHPTTQRITARLTVLAGISHFAQADYPRAIASLQAGLHLYSALGTENQDTAFQLALADIYGYLGGCHRHQKRYKEALTNYEQAIKLVSPIKGGDHADVRHLQKRVQEMTDAISELE